MTVEFGILQVKLDEFVKPRNAIADYRTDITGITATDLDGVTCSLADVQILVGHSLYNDFRAHRLDASSAKCDPLASMEQPDEPSRNKSKDSKLIKSGRSSHEEKKNG
ncbi:small RNA degrading nuclease 1-like [Ipomoea triloba]|uniref:small RNA degrading nuclease 1-like n=1 Tax=Ipomoea triloba TaxID=35885 RepID=UPI00125E7BAE|nr:small RNA degrading nuclease 1-like [Ipomoea triloba]